MASPASLQSSSMTEPTESRRDNIGRQDSHVNSAERRINDVPHKENPRQGKTRSSQQRGKHGGGRQGEVNERPQPGDQQGDNPSKLNSSGELQNFKL